MEYKQLLSNPQTLMELVVPFVFSKWKLYRAEDVIFPLSDNPVLARQNHIYLPLAPDLLLEIDLNAKTSDKKVCSHLEKISSVQYREFEKRTIENSSREIIFGRPDLLVEWQKSGTYKKQLGKIAHLSKP